MKKILPVILFLLSFSPAFCQQKTFDILSYGAKGDGETDNTLSVQKAIDEASASGGGTVEVPAGKFVTGVIHLKSNVGLHLAADGVLMGSPRRIDYGAGRASALIVADGQQNISITGKGTIDGQAAKLIKDLYRMLKAGTLEDKEWQTYNEWRQIRPAEENRPKIIEWKNCDGVQVKGVTIKDGLDWVQKYTNCSNLVIDSITVQSTTFLNNDGIDIVDCKKVRITNCTINAADDGICLKSESTEGRCEDVYIEHCSIRSSASAFKLGTASRGHFSNITVRDLTIYDTYRSAIALETVDGATLENIDIRNVTARNTGNAIFLRLGRRNQHAPAGELRHVYIGDVKAEIPAGKPDKGYEEEGPPERRPHNVFPSSVVGLPGHPVQDVTLENIDITYAGNSSKKTAFFSPDTLTRIPEAEANYPEFSMFGELPVSGFYARHVTGLHLKNVRLHYKAYDFRPACLFDDVTGLSLSDLSIPDKTGLPVILLNKVKNPVLNNIQLTVTPEKGIEHRD
ncbi:MAG TPA: glycoside hydrolase family 28 protein [Puia sp.]|nr:glycoside hydrolase family 28 protein [Puia sp.]